MFKISDLNELIIKPFPWFLPIFNKWNFNFLKRNSKWKRNFRSKITFPRNFYFCGVERAPQLRNNFWPINSVIFLVKRKYPPKKKKNKKSTPTFVVCVLEPSTLRLCENIPTRPPFLSAMVPLVGSMDQNVVRFFPQFFLVFSNIPQSSWIRVKNSNSFEIFCSANLWSDVSSQWTLNIWHGQWQSVSTSSTDVVHNRSQISSRDPKKKNATVEMAPSLSVEWKIFAPNEWKIGYVSIDCVSIGSGRRIRRYRRSSAHSFCFPSAHFSDIFFFPASKDVKRAAQLSKLLRAFRPILFQSRALNSVGSVFIEGSTWLVTYTQINRPLDDRHHFIHSRIIQLLI